MILIPLGVSSFYHTSLLCAHDCAWWKLMLSFFISTSAAFKMLTAVLRHTFSLARFIDSTPLDAVLPYMEISPSMSSTILQRWAGNSWLSGTELRGWLHFLFVFVLEEPNCCNGAHLRLIYLKGDYRFLAGAQTPSRQTASEKGSRSK
jgi:hypothetical protein